MPVADFAIILPAGVTPTDFCDDALSQLGPRAISTSLADGVLLVSGEITQDEANTLLSGISARKQQALQAEADAEKDASNFEAAYNLAITDLTTLANSSATFSTAQLSNFMRRNAQIMLQLLPLAKRIKDKQI